ncbi:hypothetical protein TNCV_1735321 [Trichonephila clavipes]|nr:hypothetical protein TNCV_1735321 [Trichonephila clavipes]
MSGVKKKLSGSQKRKIRKEKEYNINSKYAKLDNFLISASSSCASASSSNARELDEQGQAHPGIHKRRIWSLKFQKEFRSCISGHRDVHQLLTNRPSSQKLIPYFMVTKNKAIEVVYSNDESDFELNHHRKTRALHYDELQ